MHWWRSDGWADVIADSEDPAVARLALNAAAGHAIGFDALSAAAESPDVVYAYNRAGADDAYAADVVAALEAYDRTTTALMSAGMPESVAASRAALVFGIPEIDGRYLEVARQPVMPSDILVASADEALARAFAHLVPDEVVKADEPWDESEVNRDALGRFAPEGAAAQQAYRVVGGKKVAIAQQVQISEQSQKRVEEVKASSTDEQMLAELARQNEEQRQFAEAKRAKRLKRLNRIRGIRAEYQAQQARREAEAKTEQKTEARAETKAVTTEEQKRKILARKTTRQGMTAEQLAEARKVELKEKASREHQLRREEQARHQLKYGGVDPATYYDPDTYNVWEQAGAAPERLSSTGEESRKLLDPQGTELVSSGEDINLLVESGSRVVDGAALVSTLLDIRGNIVRSVSPFVLTPDGEEVIKLHRTMEALADQARAPDGRHLFDESAYVWVSPRVYARLSDLLDAVIMSTLELSGSYFVEDDFPVAVYNSNTGVFHPASMTLRLPSTNSPSLAQSMSIGKSDEPWDESSVVRDAIGRFAPEGARTATVGGRKVLVKARQAAEQGISVEQAAERSSTDVQDLEWIARRNREAAARRVRLARIRAARAARSAQPQEQAAPKETAVSEQRETATKRRKLVARKTVKQGLSKVQLAELTQKQAQQLERVNVNVARMERVNQQVPDEALEPGEDQPVLVLAGSPVGQALLKHVEYLRVGGDADEFVLRIRAEDVDAGLQATTPGRAVRVIAPGGGILEDKDLLYLADDGTRRGLFITPESADLLERVYALQEQGYGAGGMSFRLKGDGKRGSGAFELTWIEEEPDSQETMLPTRVEEQGHRSSPYS